MKRQTLGILIIAVVAAAGFGLRHLWLLASVGAAYKSKILCSAVFVSGRTPASVLKSDVAVDDLAALRFLQATVDRDAGTVTAGLGGLVERSAQYRPGRGCTLVYDGFNLQPSEDGAPPAPGDADDAWPRHLLQAPPDNRANLNTVRAAVDWAFTEPEPERPRRTRAVVIVHNGRIVGERYAPGFERNTPLIGWSMAKSVMHALTGILVGQGAVSVAERVNAPAWPEGDKRRTITVNHLLHMSSGLAFDEQYGDALSDAARMLFLEPDMARYATLQPLAAEPGTRWAYSTGTTNILSGLIRRKLADDDYSSFARRALFEPLGMDSAVIERDASGTWVGAAFMYATARDWARFGQLYLQDGVWAGRDILPEGWVDHATTPAPAAGDGQYGAHFWLTLPAAYTRPERSIRLPEEAFHAIGLEGQFVTVIPSAGLVIVRLGLTRIHGAWPHDVFIHKVLAGATDR